MTGFEAIANAVRTRFGTEVEDALSIPVQYDNAPFSKPADSTWIRLSVLPELAFQAEAGSGKRFHIPLRAVAQIFVPIETGDQVALELADSITSSFRATTASNVTYRTPSVTNVGRVDRWHQVNVSIPAYAQDFT
jgi:hypothetical protein